MFLNSLTQTDKPQNPLIHCLVIKPQKDYEEFDNVESFKHLFMAEPENAESTVQFDAKYYKEHQETPNQETPTEFPKSDIKQYFTFDDVPPLKWRERSIEMLTWCTIELQYYTIDVVIKIFLTRLQGRLRGWNHSLGEYHQLQIQQSISPKAFMSIIYSKFIGSPWEDTTHAREEFLKMKCCSFQKKDLEKYYDRMSQRFYCLNGVDDALNQVEPVDVSDLVESLYSLDDEPSDSVLCTIAYSDFSSDDDSDTDSLESDSDFGVHMINPIPHVLLIQGDPPLPLAKIHLLTDAYAKPILVIAFFDTGSSVSILNPNILPDHYWKPHHQNFMAANQEKFFEQLVSQGIIEPTTSPWACEAFYVNKRSEQVRGKLRLVINYQPLNHFLADDKFPLPQKNSCFSTWQMLGSSLPVESNAAWFKKCPSAFQKAMTTIFEPILANTLVYIDDILLFSPDEQSHAELLSKFYSLVAKYGIMLLEKKMEVGVTTIQFLGMEISDKKYQPQPHVAQELLKFPNELSSQKMIQQFLG
ncbi:putative zinc finger, CCHC-type containing protein, partial [Tanacetum coccineum]